MRYHCRCAKQVNGYQIKRTEFNQQLNVKIACGGASPTTIQPSDPENNNPTSSGNTAVIQFGFRFAIQDKFVYAPVVWVIIRPRSNPQCRDEMPNPHTHITRKTNHKSHLKQKIN